MKPQTAFAPPARPTVLAMREPASTLDHSLKEIYDDISRRAYELFAERGYQDGYHLEDWIRAESEALEPVPVEIVDNDETFTVNAEVPGFAPKDLEVKVDPSRVLIRGRAEATTQETTGKTIYTECQKNQIFRVVDLPAQVNPDRVTANLQDGILQITLHKAATPKANKVEVKAA
jgi:HSP20 family protein